MTGNILDSLCSLLSEKLKYGPNERDMVILRHQFGIRLPNGKTVSYLIYFISLENKNTNRKIKENRSSTMVVYGDSEFSAMAKTVGYPAAVAAKLILEGFFNFSFVKYFIYSILILILILIFIYFFKSM